MIDVILYTRKDCHLCEVVKEALDKLHDDVPHQLTEIDIDSDSKLRKEFDEIIPVVKIGPYTLNSPIENSDLEITMRAAYQRDQQITKIEEDIASGRLQVDIPWGRADRFTFWLSRNWLNAFNIFVLIYVGLPFLAPLLLRAGATTPANWIYRGYSVVCHQFAFRSWFLFGDQPYYPREEAHISEVVPYDRATGLSSDDLWAARGFEGDENVGYKVALCQRDVAIYFGILGFGLLYAATGRRLFGIPWYVWIAFGILPIAFDGVSQLISQPPLNLLPYRESTPVLRTLTGFLFGFVTAWFGYPIAEESMRESRDYLTAKLNRLKINQET
jgi:uncharacterized membrane protein